MAHPQFDRDLLLIRPLAEREDRVVMEKDGADIPAGQQLAGEALHLVAETADRIVAARKKGRAVIMAFGAHVIKNGLGPVLIKMMEEGWVTHLATNGAGIIHDWELAYRGRTSEHVKQNVEQGTFGLWRETGLYLNLALAVGAYEELGYGESIGKMIMNDGLTIPSIKRLRQEVVDKLAESPDDSAAAADLLDAVRQMELSSGRMEISHKFKRNSVQAAACRLNVPFTGHPMIGQDIIYLHPACQGGAVGRTGLRDFLAFAHSVQLLDGGGVYLSVGSAVMSPMIFEKAMSMCQNLLVQKGRKMTDHYIAVVDLVPPPVAWKAGDEPAEGDASYYVRFHKTFNRMGGTLRYACADNRDFIPALYRELHV